MESPEWDGPARIFPSNSQPCAAIPKIPPRACPNAPGAASGMRPFRWEPFPKPSLNPAQLQLIPSGRSPFPFPPTNPKETKADIQISDASKGSFGKPGKEPAWWRRSEHRNSLAVVLVLRHLLPDRPRRALD